MTDFIRPMSGEEWAEANQRDLVAQVQRIRALLVLGGDELPGSRDTSPATANSDDFALAALTRLFGLSSFERDVVVLCAAIELDGSVGDLVAAAHGDPARRLPTFGLALARLPDPHWSAITPAAPLRRWRLIELASSGLTDASLRLDERILHFLAGVNQLDERLRALLEPVADYRPETDADELAKRVAARLTGGATRVVQVTGPDSSARLSVSAAAGVALDGTVLRLSDGDIPDLPDSRHELALLCAREWLLARTCPVVEVASDLSELRVAAFARAVAGPLIVSSAEPLPALADVAPAVEVPTRSHAERLALWRSALGVDAGRMNGGLTDAASQFDLGPGAIAMVAAEGSRDKEALWDACRIASRSRMDGLARRIDARAGWDDLILPEPQRQTLRVIAGQVRQRHRVYHDWGFAERSARGLSISALFVGESGTGKTMAAEVLARELRLDLFSIDLATVVSKYIGETEKNLRRLFDAAEGSGAILLFDEADAIFGKRTEVHDSHDRYANVEVSYLLQRMEAYGGLAILTTNMKAAIDPAFLRRIRFVVQFPFPDVEQRAAMWRGIFPQRTPVELLDYAQLARLSVAGGHIRNIAMAGAFLAADQAEPVSMRHLAEATRTEYAKIERPLTDAETRGWA